MSYDPDAESLKILEELKAVSNIQKRDYFPSFFKALPGGYGEGDKFLGVVVPDIRAIAKRHREKDFDIVAKLIENEYHECRLCGLLILVEKYKCAKSETDRKDIVSLYLSHTRYINNWDLVDLSCRDILGLYLCNKTDRTILYTLANDGNLWEQRIAVISTFAFIRQNDFIDVVKLCEMLLSHPHDLIHKACGWMLREAGKRDKTTLTDFLDKHSARMPRTMLRYSIEKLSPDERRHYMGKA